MHTPYHDEALDKVYNLLFCDDINLYRPEQGESNEDYPWGILLAAAPDPEGLKKIVADTTSESRVVLLAAAQLTKAGITPEKELLGVIIEVGMSEGLDTLAAYADGTARYINHSGRIVIWEAPTKESEALIDDLFVTGEEVVNKIGKWDKERLAAPGAGDIRLSFLVSDGLYFGQGPFDVMQQDAMGGPVIQAAIALLQFLTAQQQ